MSTTLGKSYLSTLPMKIKKTVILSTSCRLDEIVQKLGVSATDASMLLVVFGTREAEMMFCQNSMSFQKNHLKRGASFFAQISNFIFV